MENRTICVVQHTQCETLGGIADALQAEHLAWEVVLAHEQQPIPKTMDPYAGLILMGGPVSVYEQDRYGYLKHEIALLEQALKQKKPILAVCLGSQLLADALGSPVKPGNQKEIGWYPVKLTEFALGDALWKGVPRSFMAFHWHGDVFELPSGAVPLAASELTACQAFRYGKSAYGLLFHAEVNKVILEGMVKSFAEELRQAGITSEQILALSANYLPNLHYLGTTVFQRWSRQVID